MYVNNLYIELFYAVETAIFMLDYFIKIYLFRNKHLL